MGNKKAQKMEAKRRTHRKRLLRALFVTGSLVVLGLKVHHEFVGIVAGGASAAFFDLVFEVME